MISVFLLASHLAFQCPDGAPPPCTRLAPAGPNSVAVLLFNNVAHDSAFAYLGDGLASEIATSLAAVPRLEVRSPGMVRRIARATDLDPQVMGRRLNVRYVVEGDYQRGGDRIRVSVRLTTVATGTARWSNAYTRSATDLLAVQEDVAREVATSIAGQLLPQERTALAAHPTRNPEAWDHFMRGNYYLARRTGDAVALGISEYEAAVHLDPSFAQAEARIALAYGLDIDWGWPSRLSPDSQLALGLAAAARALARDSQVSDGWMARGYLLGFRDPEDYTLALADLRRAVTLDPRNAEALHQYASKLQELNINDSAVAVERRALDADPDRAISQLVMGKAFRNSRRLDDARHAFDSALAINPAFYVSIFYRGQIELGQGDVAAACRDIRSATSTAVTGDPWSMGNDAVCLAAQGDTSAALRTLTRDAAAYDTLTVIPIYPAIGLGFANMRVGRKVEAIRWIERARPRGAILWAELLSPSYDPLRTEPEFLRFMASIKPVGARD